MENPTMERVAAGMYGEKLFTASQYKRVEKAMKKYNHGLASRFAMYAQQDEAIAEILAEAATDVERVQHMVYPQPFIVPFEVPKGEDAQPASFAIDLLQNVILMEKAAEADFKKMINDPNALFQKILGKLNVAVNVYGLEYIARIRAWECKKMIAAIESGALIHRDKESPFYCTRCGTLHKGKEAFNECDTCKAKPQYCALPFEYL